MAETTTMDRSNCTARRHGTKSAYEKCRCRCPDARAARNAYLRAYRARMSYDALNVQAALTRTRFGDPPPLLRTRERHAVVGILTTDGWSAIRIAKALGLSQRTVVRHRAALRRQAA